MHPWFSLIIASICEILWLLCLKYMDWGKIKTCFLSLEIDSSLLPLLGYIGFGIANVYFYSIATKSIPLSVSFAVWMGIALIGTKMIDTFYFKENINFLQILFLAFIAIGIIGLQTSTVGVKK